MKHFRVDFRTGESTTTEQPDHVSPDGWWNGIKSDKKTVVINGKTHLVEDIIGVIEIKPRHGFTNMEGI